MIAYKFLATGALGPLSDFAWPEPSAGSPGAWVNTQGELRGLEQSGVHVCREADLAYWLHDELWVVETDGASREDIDHLLVGRARLVRCIRAWQQGGALRFALACAAHATALSAGLPADRVGIARDYIEDAVVSGQAGYIGVSAHAAALAATLACVELGAQPNEAAAYRAERRWQSDWIVQHIVRSEAPR